MIRKIYIAGPMRGYPMYNFPAFDAAALKFRKFGWEVINPAELDREIGVNEYTDPLPDGFMRDAMTRDLSAICKCDAVALLPGWEKSTGALIEVHLAMILGLELYDVEGNTVTPPVIKIGPLEKFTATVVREGKNDESITEEAHRITNRDRRDVYGHPYHDFKRIAQMWAPLLGVEKVTPQQVGLCMIALKLGRLCHSPNHRDSLVDIAGYANCLDMIRQLEETEGTNASK